MCTFHVGGAPDGETSAICRWEFFIGDRPHCTSVSIDDLAAARQPMEQISSIEHFLDPGEVAVSTEVAQQASPLSRVHSAEMLETGHVLAVVAGACIAVKQASPRNQRRLFKSVV